MTVNELITRASAAYPDGLIAMEYWDFERECPRRNPKGGDTLALFIALEIKDTYDPDASDREQAENAARAMERASDELVQVAAGLRAARGKNEKKRHVRSIQ